MKWMEIQINLNLLGGTHRKKFKKKLSHAFKPSPPFYFFFLLNFTPRGQKENQ
jgi:hypothetical protein